MSAASSVGSVRLRDCTLAESITIAMCVASAIRKTFQARRCRRFVTEGILSHHTALRLFGFAHTIKACNMIMKIKKTPEAQQAHLPKAVDEA